MRGFAARRSGPPRPRRHQVRGASGMTLLEVLLAVAILGICLAGIMRGIGACMDVYRSSAFVQRAIGALARAEADWPLTVQSDPEEDLAVDHADLGDGWSFSRTCEPDEDEDALYVLRSEVSLGHGGPGAQFEVIRLMYLPGYGEGGAP